MAYSTKNIIVGAAAVFMSKIDSTDPAFTTTEPIGVDLPTLAKSPSGKSVLLETVTGSLAHSASPFENVGYTTEGVEFSYEPDFGEVQVDQMLDVAKMFKQGMRASVNTTFAEATLKNLMIAWGQSAGSLESDVLTIKAGDLGEEPVERSLAFVGGAPRNASGDKRERVYHVRRALQVEASNHSLSRNDATTIPVSFRLLPELGASGADYGTVRDRVVTP